MNILKVQIIQHDIHWANPKENQKRLEQQLAEHPGADLYVLCEMWPTGFSTKPENMAEEALDSPSLRWMLRMAKQHDAAIAGSIATRQDGHYYNRLYFVKPDGEVEYYDKRHLFTYSGEHLHFTRGERRVIVEWRGVRILLQVCYDLRFPTWSRNHWNAEAQQPDYDVILYVANWPVSRIEAWNTLLRARAIENQCYVVGVNRIGEDPNCQYCGASAIIDPYGFTVSECEKDRECTADAILEMDKLAVFRIKFPVLKDGDF